MRNLVRAITLRWPLSPLSPRSTPPPLTRHIIRLQHSSSSADNPPFDPDLYPDPDPRPYPRPPPRDPNARDKIIPNRPYFPTSDQAGRYRGLIAALARYTATHPESRKPRGPIQPWLEDIVRVNGSNAECPPQLFAWTPANLLPEEQGTEDQPESELELDASQNQEQQQQQQQPPRELDGTGMPMLEPEPDPIETKEHEPSPPPPLPEMVDDGNPERVYVIGAGNLGRLFAATFSRYPSPPPITLVVHRPELLRHWAARPYLTFTPAHSTEPLFFSDFNVELWSPDPPPTGPVREVANGQAVRRLLVTTRANEALMEVDRVRRYLSNQSIVMFAQNGMCRLWPPGGAHYIALRYQNLPEMRPNYGAVITTHGVVSSGPFESVHASWAGVIAGPVLLNDAAPTQHLDTAFLDLFATPALGGSLVSSSDLFKRQLDKLHINAIINPLTTILRCKNGVLFERKTGPIHDLMQALTFEIWLVFRKLLTRRQFHNILKTNEGDDVPSQQRFEYCRAWDLLFAVGEQVKDNTSSMLQHVLLGKPTEIQEFNGWILGMAKLVRVHHGDMACNKKLVELVESGAVLGEADLENAFDLENIRARQWETVRMKVRRLDEHVAGITAHMEGRVVPPQHLDS